MTDHRRQPPLVLRPRPSMRLLGFVLASHGAALAVLAPLPLALGIKLLLTLLIVAHLSCSLWARVFARAPWSIVEAAWTEQGWALTTRAGRTLRARLLPSSYVGVRLVVLNLRIGMLRSVALVLTPDAVTTDQLRRLRARLRLHGTAAAGRDAEAGAA